MNNLKQYSPKRSPSTGDPLESESQYCDRIKKLLPNFPEEVVRSWLYTHSDVDDYYFLNFSTMQYKKESWLSEKIFNSGIKDNETISSDIAHCEQKNLYRSKEYLEKCFKTHSTWSIPPVLLHNPNNDITTPYGYKLTSPYHVLDGSHRIALLVYLYKNDKINKNILHSIWVAKIKQI